MKVASDAPAFDGDEMENDQRDNGRNHPKGRENERKKHVTQRKDYEVQSDELQSIRHGANGVVHPTLGETEQENAHHTGCTKK